MGEHQSKTSSKKAHTPIPAHRTRTFELVHVDGAAALAVKELEAGRELLLLVRRQLGALAAAALQGARRAGRVAAGRGEHGFGVVELPWALRVGGRRTGRGTKAGASGRPLRAAAELWWACVRERG